MTAETSTTLAVAHKRRKRKRKKSPKRKPAAAGPWTPAHVRRLFWRAGFGATQAELDRFTAAGKQATLDWLLDGDGPAELRGPGPSADGKPLDINNEWGHDHLWWLDRMVRTTRPLEERMTLFWHSHFATRDVDTPLMLAQNRKLREHALGDFDALLRAVTLDPAMQQFLSLMWSYKDDPNENYARELMELFTIGTGYGEDDVREAARALTGFVPVPPKGVPRGVRWDPKRHDDGSKTIFGKTGEWTWEDVLGLVLNHPKHAGFITTALWDYFIPTPIPAKTRRKLALRYRASGRKIKPLVREILGHPHLYADLERPGQLMEPVVKIAGTLRALGAPVNRHAYTWMSSEMGQQLLSPPSVAGWEGGVAWASSATMRARFIFANELGREGGPLHVPEGALGEAKLPANEQVDRARIACGNPWLSPATVQALLDFAAADAADEDIPPELTQRALRHLIVTCPDAQLC